MPSATTNQTSLQREPATVSASSDEATSYFNVDSSKTTSAETTPMSTPGLKLDDKPLPALLREFPKPAQDIDVQSLLAQKPGRWTFQGQIEANQRRVKTSTEEEIKTQRTRDFEKAKEELRAQWRA